MVYGTIYGFYLWYLRRVLRLFNVSKLSAELTCQTEYVALKEN